MNSYPGVDKDHADVRNLSDMAGILQENNRAIDEIRNNMIELAKESPLFEIINSFYGIGEVLAAELFNLEKVLMYMEQYLKEAINM